MVLKVEAWCDEYASVVAIPKKDGSFFYFISVDSEINRQKLSSIPEISNRMSALTAQIMHEKYGNKK